MTLLEKIYKSISHRAENLVLCEDGVYRTESHIEEIKRSLYVAICFERNSDHMADAIMYPIAYDENIISKVSFDEMKGFKDNSYVPKFEFAINSSDWINKFNDLLNGEWKIDTKI